MARRPPQPKRPADAPHAQAADPAWARAEGGGGVGQPGSAKGPEAARSAPTEPKPAAHQTAAPKAIAQAAAAASDTGAGPAGAGPAGAEPPTAVMSKRRKRRIGPRGLSGIFGWTFFDPANLVSIALLSTSAALSLHTLRTRDGADAPMAVLMYLCMAGLLRGYFFTYYHGGAFSRVLILLGNLVGLLGSAALWIDRAEAFTALRTSGLERLPDSPALRWAGTLHLVVGGTLALHLLVPRRWMIKATDEIADRTGRDSAHDAPLESIDDPVARAARAAEIAAKADRPAAREAELLAQVERGVRRVTGRRAKGTTGELAQAEGRGTGEQVAAEPQAKDAGDEDEPGRTG